MGEPGSRNRRSIRLRNFDYAGNATYFVTLCTRRRECLFGEIEGGLVVLNSVGEIAEREWMRSSLLRAELDLHSFVVMPNHLHGMLTIMPMEQDQGNSTGVIDDRPCPRREGDDHAGASQQGDQHTGARHVPLRQAPRSLGSFVAGYKAATFREVNRLMGSAESIWQRGYYEHVVRDERDFQRIVEYMANNPFNWSTDRENANRAESRGE